MGTVRLTRRSRWSPRSMAKSSRGFTIPELLIAMSILIFLMTVVFGLLATSQTAYYNADAGIQLRTIFRNVGQKMAWELSHSGYDAVNGAQFVITAGAGANGSDIIRFSVPVACNTTSTFLDTAGNPGRWGAYLTWGCDQLSCSDPDGNCATVEYKYVQYELNSQGQILRKVLDPTLAVVVTQGLADSITNLHFAVNGTAGVTFTMTGQKKSSSGLMVTDGISQTVRFMN